MWPFSEQRATIFPRVVLNIGCLRAEEEAVGEKAVAVQLLS